MNNDITPGVNIGTANPGSAPPRVATGSNYASSPPSSSPPAPTSTTQPTPEPALPPPRPRLSSRRVLGLGLIAVALLAAALAWYGARAAKQHQAAALLESSQRIKPQTVELSGLAEQLHATSSANTLTVNGQANIVGSVVLEPSTQPAKAAAGQLYYDSTSNLLSYYNGSHFVGLPGGGNTLVTNNNTTNLAGPTNITNIAGATNVTNNITNVTGGGVGETTGVAGSIAMFTASNLIGPSLITQNGSNLDTGSGVENVTLGSLAATSATNLQGGTGGVQIATGTAAGISGDVNIASGVSTGSAAGNVNIDTGTGLVSGTVVYDLDFESGTDNVDAWTGLGTTVAQDCTQAHSGSCSLNLTGGPFAGAILNGNFSLIPIDSGHHYFFSVWVKAATVGASMSAKIYWNGFTLSFTGVTDNTTGWTDMTASGVAPAGATSATFSLGSGANSVETHYFDDFVVTDLSSSATISTINLGATNAQEVNIGNANEINATTVQGSGVTINGGEGNLDMSGGAFNLTGQATSTISTTNQGLNISSAGAANWGVVGLADIGNGNNLTLTAGDAADGGNNGGNILLQPGFASGGGNSGGVIIKPTDTDSQNAFQVQNASGSNLLTVDSTNTQIVLGNDGTPTDLTVRGGDAAGTDVAGGNLTIDASNGTGAGGSGGIIFQTAPSGADTVGYDNSGGGYQDSAVLTQSFTTGSGSNRLLLVQTSTSLARSFSGVTYDGLALTELSSQNAAPGDESLGADDAVWYLLNPPTGTFDIVATYAATFSDYTGEINAASFDNVDQTTPFGTPSMASGSTSNAQLSNLAVASTSTDQLVIDAFDADNYATNTADQHQVWFLPANPVSPEGFTAAGFADRPGTGGNVNFGWSVTGGDWADIGVAINPAAATSTTSDVLSDRLNIAANGNVGINEPNPQATLDVAGTELVQADSASAFVVQNTSAAPLLTADTTTMTVTVNALVVATDITVNGHIITGGTTPGIAAGSAACTSPTVGVIGDDTSGTITITTGSGCSAGGKLATLTFATAYGAAPHVTLTPGSSNAQTLGAYIDDATVSATTFDLDSNTTPGNTTTYKWNYWVAQ